MGIITACYTAVSILGCTMYPGAPSELIFNDFKMAGKGFEDGAWYTMGLIALFLVTFSLLGSYPIVSSAVRNSVMECIELFTPKADRSKTGWQNTKIRRGIVVIGYMTVVVLLTVWVSIYFQNASS